MFVLNRSIVKYGWWTKLTGGEISLLYEWSEFRKLGVGKKFV
jgi:hypothetical protein